jgi:hypothetical protein
MSDRKPAWASSRASVFHRSHRYSCGGLRRADRHVEKIGPLSDAAVPEAVRQTLDLAGYRVSLDDGTTFCQLWLRKSIPTRRKRTLQMWSTGRVDVGGRPAFSEGRQ